MMTVQKLRDGWASGRPALGLWAAVPSAFAAEMMAVEGVSYICVTSSTG